ncbi:TerB family tellurite resistance protein [Streptomyces sp. BI20]|uniref:TerB family tellurite resistance protein n=1 Tax=Streptomyces sp. BI20 TaxID=3403460 RepID=UPI003C77B041
MLPVRGGNGRRLTAWGVRTTWTTVGDGEFFCPDCGGDRNYRRRTGRRRFTLLGVPVLGRGEVDPVVECAECRAHHEPEVLEQPTTTRFSALLREAAHTVALAVLAVGGAGSPAALRVAGEGLRAAGLPEAGPDELAELAANLGRDPGTGDPRAALRVALHETLGPLAPHLAPVGREALFLQGARTALADGPYTAPEREVLRTIGEALDLDAGRVAGLLTAGRREAGA